MAKHRQRRTKSIPMTIGQDASLWRFASLNEALKSNTDLIARMIRTGEAITQASGGNTTEESVTPLDQLPVSKTV